MPKSHVSSPVSKYRRVLAMALIGATGAVLFVGGCQQDSSDERPQANRPAGGQEQSERAVERSDSSDTSDGATEPESSGTPETPEDVVAADGTDPDACQDADCQVELATGDVLRPKLDGLPLDTITVAKVGTDQVRLTMAGRTGQGMSLEGVDITISSECVGDRCQDSGELTVTTEVPGKINDVSVQLDQVREGRAVLTFEPR